MAANIPAPIPVWEQTPKYTQVSSKWANPKKSLDLLQQRVPQLAFRENFSDLQSSHWQEDL